MKRVWISEDADPRLAEYLGSAGRQVCRVAHTDAVGHAVSAHPDIYMCRLGAGAEAEVFFGDRSELGPDYPQDVRFNAVVTSKYVISLNRVTSPALIRAAEKLYPGIRLINVPQGYTKCNMVVIDGTHFITEDAGIAKALSNYSEIACLTVSAGHVALRGFKNGFLGGASGRVGSDIVFNGDLSSHPDFERIKAFIVNCGLNTVFFPEWQLTDIGSIISE
jgi:hypothetical protein